MEAKKTGAPEGTPVFFETQCKDTDYNQLCKAQIAFFERPRTMMQAERLSGVRRENICRYAKTMKKANAIWIAYVGKCPITGHGKVQFLTTNPKYAEGLPKQLELFPL